MADSNRYPHLSPLVAEVADLDDQARLDYVAKDRFIPYPRADEVFAEMEDLYRRDDAIRPQGRLLVGHPLMGKTTLIAEFLRRHSASDNPEGDAAIVPVVSVQFPEIANDGVYPEILARLNARLPKASKPRDLRQTTVDFLGKVGMRLLIIDEFHNILEGNASAQRKGLNSIKYLMNELRRPVVVIGTAEVINAIKSDPQIYSRLRPMILPRFQDDAKFQELLVGFEALLPLRKPSNLHDPELSSLIYQYTLGIMGNVSDLLNDAAKLAIKNGTEQITEAELTTIKDKSDIPTKTLMELLG